MKNVYFKSIIIADLQSETARSQTFEKGFNVITSADNHVGKSSLLKSLYYLSTAQTDAIFMMLMEKNIVWHVLGKIMQYLKITSF